MSKRSEHPSFEALVDFVNSDRNHFGRDAMLFMMDINAHLIECRECLAIKDELLKLRDSVSWLSKDEGFCVQNRAILKLLLTASELRPGNARKVGWVADKASSALFAVSATVSSTVERTRLYVATAPLFQSRMDTDFGYPLAIGLRGENNDTSSDNTILIDDNNEKNKVQIVGNTKIVVNVDVESDTPLIAVLLPTSDAAEAKIFEMQMCEGRWCAEFENVVEGEYEIIVE